MHILFICQTFPEPNNQRKGIFYRDQAAALQKAGHQVGVIALGGLDGMQFNPAGLKNWNKQISYFESGFPIYRALRIPLPFKSRETRLRLWTITAPVVHAVGRYIAQHGIPDILHSQNFFYAGLAGIRISQKYSLPHVLTEHSSLFLDDLRLDKLHLIKDKLPHINQVLAVSAELADRMRQFIPGTEIQIIGNIVNTDLFCPGTFEKPPIPFTFTIAAYLDANKNVSTALLAFHHAFAGARDFRLVICGEGPEKETLVTLADKPGLSRQVQFVDFLPREELIALYRRSHVVVSASYHETFGLTLVEAMACGLPVIATRSGGPQGYVTDQVGMLVEPGSVQDMSEAMQTIYQNYDTYNSKNIRTYCVQNFSEAAIVRKLTAMYKHVMANTIVI